MRAAALIDVLHEAGVACHELAVWSACTAQDGHVDGCEACSIGGPDRCEGEVIKALARRLVEATCQTDEALAQRDVAARQRDRAVRQTAYWGGVVDRLCAVVTASESTRECHQKRHR